MADKKKVMAVYKRRGKAEHDPGECGVDDKHNSSRSRSWIDRCLSSRRTSVILNRFDVQKVPIKRCNLKKFSDEFQKIRKRVVAPAAPPANFVQEKQAHFAEVDAFELQEESPPKPHYQEGDKTAVFDDAYILRARNGPLAAVPEEVYLTPEEFLSAALRTPPVRAFLRQTLTFPECSSKRQPLTDTTNKLTAEDLITDTTNKLTAEDLIPDLESLDIGGDKSTVEDEVECSIIDQLLRDSGQQNIVSLGEAFSQFCNLKNIVKIGEGTYGEAYKANGNVFKVVPMDGSFKVNGETQKSSTEIYSEVLLSNTLNKLRDTSSSYYCTSFVETKATRICQGKYDKDLVRAWKRWDAVHDSENDQPLAFPEEQLYVVFVLADGGTDLEGYDPLTYNEVRSLLLQVVLSLAVAEQAYGFEHRDLHWGNIVLSKTQQEQLDFRLNGKSISMRAHGLSVVIIDFTLSRIDTGKQVVFCDLSDPSWFEGPEGNVQADTYRRMREVTNGRWEGRFPKNNSLWIHYLAEIIRKEKSCKLSAKEKRALCAFSKRCLQMDSAAALIEDKFFENMWK